MKTKWMITLITLGLILSATPAMAKDKPQSTDSPAAVEKAVQGPVQLRGIIEKAGDDLILFNGETTYILIGDDSLEKMAGQPVSIIGQVKKEGNQTLFLVNQAAFVR